ncbi:MAG TPA: hypothetical protein IGS17_08795 [Oscillatoriales cyanobacterium M59_W2019_021]|nr:hypothetical protein [Oscillatoriales cyanobacterium M4454_W2019_049]HIK51006.1 hypothetical protein [Oscillatoriales cyanobacterium M59_W2019_021]
MQIPLDRFQVSLEDLYAQIWKTGYLTQTQQQQLKSMRSLDKRMTSGERETIDRLMHAIRRGWLKVVQ